MFSLIALHCLCFECIKVLWFLYCCYMTHDMQQKLDKLFSQTKNAITFRNTNPMHVIFLCEAAQNNQNKTKCKQIFPLNEILYYAKYKGK